MKTTVVLGAGFSKNSGIPVQDEIPALLIQGKIENEFDRAVTKVIYEFMQDVFGYREGAAYPNLDDLLTCIDISTNSGHHLGMKYSPIHLRFIRRMIIYRIFSIFENRFKPSVEVSEFIKHLSDKSFGTSYVVLNWDTVLEKYLMSLPYDTSIDYCHEGKPLEADQDRRAEKSTKVLKIHGSCNWLYCDNCRSVFHDMGEKIKPVRKAGFQQIDMRLFPDFSKMNGQYTLPECEKCSICHNDIYSHIATFSYRKSFRANSFPDIWKKAEDTLAKSDRWIFVGYSLPEADYEFKHLLKISELKFAHMRENKLHVDIVLLGGESAVVKYRHLFGNKINIVCNKGISEYMNYKRIDLGKENVQ